MTRNSIRMAAAAALGAALLGLAAYVDAAPPAAQKKQVLNAARRSQDCDIFNPIS